MVEQIVPLVLMNIFLLPLLIIGIVLCCGKGVKLIAGYNTARQAKRERWKEKPLCRATGILVLILYVCIELFLFGISLGVAALAWCGGIALAVSLAVGLLYINKSKRFKKW